MKHATRSFTSLLLAVCLTLTTLLCVCVMPDTRAAVLGDIDQNGALDSRDARLLLSHIVKSDPLPADKTALADCRADGVLDTNDVYEMLLFIMGIKTAPAVTTTTTRPSLDDDGYYDQIVKP